MFGEGRPIIYDAPADLKKWPSLKGQRLNGGRQPYRVFNGTLSDCIRELLATVRHRHRAPAGFRQERAVTG
jgi:hypothetical protein